MKPPERVLIEFDGKEYEYKLVIKLNTEIQQPKVKVPEIKNIYKSKIRLALC